MQSERAKCIVAIKPIKDVMKQEPRTSKNSEIYMAAK